MKKWFMNLSIKFKILLFFYSLLALYSFIFYIYSNNNAYDSVIHNVGNANVLLLQQIGSNITFMQKEIEDMSTQLILHPQIQNFISPSNGNNNYSQKLYIDMKMKEAVNLIVSKDYISTLYIYGFSNNSVPFTRTVDRNFYFPEISKYMEDDFFIKVSAGDGKPVWNYFGGGKTILDEKWNNNLIMARTIKEYNSYKTMGLLLVSINESALRQIYTKGVNTKNCMIAIQNEQGYIVSRAGINLEDEMKISLNSKTLNPAKGYYIDNIGNKKMLLSYTKDESNNWTYIYAVPMSELFDQINSTRTYLLVFLTISLLLLFPLIIFASELIVMPIKKLLLAMKGFQTGDFDSLISFRYKDEIGQLGNGYNEMVKNIKNLIDQVYILQIKEQEAEFTALQAQINPHFLYNTLDSIFWKAQKNGQKEIADMVWYLSNVFRMSLNKGRRFNTVKYEFEFLENYLRLQQLRYGGKVNFHIYLDPEAEDIKIPKLIIQPFVENAIYHGLENKDTAGKVIVDCRLLHDTVIFSISDDGVGMSSEMIEKIQNGTYENKDSLGGYAIKNIKERLTLVYGTEYSLELHSQLGVGTRVELKLPKNFKHGG